MGAKVIPYDTRVRIVDAYRRRGNAPEVADVFGISTRAVYRLAGHEHAQGMLTRNAEAESQS